MIAALFGLGPTVLAILAAVCSQRLGICALHGQLLYFAGLLLYSLLPLSVNSLWLIPFAACVLFFVGTGMGVFMTRCDLNPRSERGRMILTGFLVLVNFLLLFLLLHSIFNIMCFRLNEAAELPAVRRFILMLQVGSGALFIWFLAGVFSGRRRAGLAAFYAWCGLLFSVYIVLISNASKVTWAMPANLQRALQIRSNMEYFTIAASAEFATALYFIPPLVAVVCGVFGYLLLKPVRKRASGCQLPPARA